MRADGSGVKARPDSGCPGFSFGFLSRVPLWQESWRRSSQSFRFTCGPWTPADGLHPAPPGSWKAWIVSWPGSVQPGSAQPSSCRQQTQGETWLAYSQSEIVVEVLVLVLLLLVQKPCSWTTSCLCSQEESWTPRLAVERRPFISCRYLLFTALGASPHSLTAAWIHSVYTQTAAES